MVTVKRKARQVAPALVHVTWLPNTWGHTVSITSINGADRQLAALSRELDGLPAADCIGGAHLDLSAARGVLMDTPAPGRSFG